ANNNRPNKTGGGAGQNAQGNRPNNGAGAGANNNQGGGRRGGNQNNNQGGKKGGKWQPKPVVKEAVSEEEVQKQMKETLSRLTNKGGKTKASKHRRDKRDAAHGRMAEDMEREQMESKVLKVTEFVTVSELATMMEVSVTEVITACMNLGLMVSINQRLDAEALVIVAEEFDYKVEFVSVEIQEAIESEEDAPEDMISRPPIVTVMGHVDHGKTSLLDYIRKANVIAGEAGGITQHIGAYSVNMEDGRRVTFLDTPGHEAFTAMRARGAKVTDVAIIIIAADDAIMPQTKEAINHAEAAGVPIIFAINKIDKDGANPDKIKEQLGAMNYLVEDWGGKYQSQDIAAKSGLNVEQLLEKVLLEAEILDLKANPNRKATGSVIESSLDKGRGYVTTILVQNGTLKVGDVLLSGVYTGRVKAMFNERGNKVEEVGPATPVLVLGLNGAPQAGDTFNVMDDDKSAREIATKREQLQRMQGLRTQKHITLDEIGRRIAIGSFKELNIIVKGDVDGSIEALTGSLIKLSNEEVQVNVIHKAVGQISESDVLLAAASNAVIVGFQVRPSNAARRIAEKEEIDIRLYSIIYDAIEEIKDAIEGMLAPETKEEIVCSVEVLETFKISKVGTIAGCLVRGGKIHRNTQIRIIRDGIVVYTGKLGSLKRFKDDVKEVNTGLDCGLNIDNFNDIKIGDFIEGYLR
ncbi:MAG: translation initiation factor IF-2, partial [Rikenellaceae bacterium]